MYVVQIPKSYAHQISSMLHYLQMHRNFLCLKKEDINWIKIEKLKSHLQIIIILRNGIRE